MRTFFTLTLFFIIVAGIQFLATDNITVLVAGYEISMSLSVALTLFVTIFFVLYSILNSISALITWSQRRGLKRQLQRYEDSFDAIGLCLQSIILHDKKGVERYLTPLKKTLRNHPLLPYIQGQACQMRGDIEGARNAYQSLMFDSKMSALGIRELTHLPDNQSQDPFHWLSALNTQQRQEPWAVRALIARALLQNNPDEAQQLYNAKRRIFDSEESQKIQKTLFATIGKISWQKYNESQKNDFLQNAQDSFRQASHLDKKDLNMRALYAFSLAPSDVKEALNVIKKSLPESSGFAFVQVLLLQIIKIFPEKERLKIIKSLNLPEQATFFQMLMNTAFDQDIKQLTYQQAESIYLQPQSQDNSYTWFCNHCQENHTQWQPVCINCKTIGSVVMSPAVVVQ